MIGSEHRNQRASFHRIILGMERPGIGVVKVSRVHRAIADLQITGQHVKVLRPQVHVRGVAHARLQFAEQNRVTPLPID